MNMQPLGPWVLVDPIPPPEKTEAGVIRVVDNMEDRLGYSYGKVLAVGPGKLHVPKKRPSYYEPIGVEKGETVFFRSFLKDVNKPRPLDSQLCLIHMDDLLGVLE